MAVIHGSQKPSVDSSLRSPKTFRSLTDIIIVADNDDDPKGRFQNVSAQIERIFGKGTGPSAPQRRALGTKPAITVLMIPWTDEHGHLEQLCCPAAKTADKIVGSHVDYFLGLLQADKWPSESRRGKAWLRANLAARCEHDPFIALGNVFAKDRDCALIPVTDPTLDPIANFLASFA